jgi:hypothetical protein
MPPPIVTSPSEVVPVEQLRQHPDNPNVGDVDAIGDLIEENGFVGSVVAQRSTGFILGGNHTWEAAVAHGMTEISVQWVDCDDSRARRIMLGLNRPRDLAVYDEPVLVRVLRELAEEDLGYAGTGFFAEDLAALAADPGYTPDYQPNIGTGGVTAEQMAASEEHMAQQMRDADAESQRRRQQVTCPACGHDFSVVGV